MKCINTRQLKVSLEDIPVNTLVEFCGITGVVVPFGGIKSVSFNDKEPLPMNQNIKFTISNTYKEINDEYAN